MILIDNEYYFVRILLQPFLVKLEQEQDPDKKTMYYKIKVKVEKAVSEVKASQDEAQFREVKV